jgi:CMP-N,N'-diacetyllegionaminic acid synthase
MENVTKNLAIVPARSGSKGLKDKNTRLLCGKPLLAYSIEAALESMMFEEVMVSTDSIIYADIAVSYGAKVPFLRSLDESSDTASSWNVVKEVLSNYKNMGKVFNTVTLLQPTSPLRTAQDIKNSFKVMQKNNARAVVSVCEVDHSPLWCSVLPENDSMDHFFPKDVIFNNRQELDKYYRINGAVYLVKTDYFLNTKTIYDNGCYAYRMDRKRSIDIDELYDFKLAECILKFG